MGSFEVPGGQSTAGPGLNSEPPGALPGTMSLGVHDTGPYAVLPLGAAPVDRGSRRDRMQSGEVFRGCLELIYFLCSSGVLLNFSCFM